MRRRTCATSSQGPLLAHGERGARLGSSRISSHLSQPSTHLGFHLISPIVSLRSQFLSPAVSLCPSRLVLLPGVRRSHVWPNGVPRRRRRRRPGSTRGAVEDGEQRRRSVQEGNGAGIGLAHGGGSSRAAGGEHRAASGRVRLIVGAVDAWQPVLSGHEGLAGVRARRRQEIVNSIYLVGDLGDAVKPFGSFVSNLYAKSGDLDVSVELPNLFGFPTSKEEKQDVLRELMIALQIEGVARDVNFIPTILLQEFQFFSMKCTFCI